MIARLLGLDLWASNAATEDAVSAIENTIDDMIAGFTDERG
jgi:hypothetical protein